MSSSANAQSKDQCLYKRKSSEADNKADDSSKKAYCHTLQAVAQFILAQEDALSKMVSDFQDSIQRECPDLGDDTKDAVVETVRKDLELHKAAS